MKKNILSLFALYISISLLYSVAGTIHLDEGAYLYAANAVYRGEVLYRDFFFLQPPVHSYIYGLFQLVYPGLFTGRLTSMLLGLITLIYLAKTARTLGDRYSDVIFLALITSNLFQIYFFTITRLYALTSALIAVSYYFIAGNVRSRLFNHTASALFISIAVATRLTILPVLPMFWLYFLMKGSNFKERVIPLIGSAGVLLLVFLPYAFWAGVDRLWFNLLGMNLSLHSNNIVANILQKCRASSQMVGFYFFPFIMTIPLLNGALRIVTKKPLKEIWRLLVQPKPFMWLISLTIVAVHITAKIYQVSYQTIIMPQIMCLLAVSWSSIFRSSNNSVRRMFTVLFVSGCILSALSYGPRSLDMIEGKMPLFALKAQANFIRNHTDEQDKLFSADSALMAVESNRRLLKGMAASDLFPSWDSAKCKYYNVLNFSIMENYIDEKSAKLLLYGDGSFTLSLPYLEPIPGEIRKSFLEKVEEHYTLIRTFPNLFIPGTKTYVYERRETP